LERDRVDKAMDRNGGSIAGTRLGLCARLSDSFAGIAPASVMGFVIAQLAGAAIGLGLHSLLEPRRARAGHPNVFEASGEHEVP
jgi:hypothetical protein